MRQKGQVSLTHSSESEGPEHILEADDALETDEALDPDEALEAEFDEPPEAPLARATLSVVNDGAAYAPSAKAPIRPIRPIACRRDKFFCVTVFSLVIGEIGPYLGRCLRQQ